MALGFSGRLGYEVGSGSVLAVPYIGYVRSFGNADLKFDGEDVGLDLSISNFQFGLGIAVH